MSLFKKTRRLVLVPIAFMMMQTACGQMSFEEKLDKLYKGTVPLIKPLDLVDQMYQKQTYLLDIRSDDEFKVSHLSNARKIDYKSFSLADVEDIPKDAAIVVYCSVGYRSEKVGEKLLKAGYQDVQNLYGGIFEWKNIGMTVVNQMEKPTDSVHTYNKKWSQWLTKGVKVYD